MVTSRLVGEKESGVIFTVRLSAMNVVRAYVWRRSGGAAAPLPPHANFTEIVGVLHWCMALGVPPKELVSSLLQLSVSRLLHLHLLILVLALIRWCGSCGAWVSWKPRTGFPGF
jgi:hypothetical protein